MNEIISILMQRDGISKLEAENLIQEAQDEIIPAIMRGDYQEVEDIFMTELKLEPDYLDILLNYMLGY